MSKSVSDQKVEDVLSSVRRLVSNELPRKPRPELPSGPGALVLTEAHRVEKAAKVNSAKGTLEDRIAELEAAVSVQPDDFEPDGSEDQAQHQPDRIVYTRPPTSGEEGSARGSTVRLSQIALIETGPANDDESDSVSSGDAPTFRRESDAKAPDTAQKPSDTKDTAAKDVTTEDTVETEAPMAVDVPVEPRKSADVRAFTDPDDVVRNIEARIASGRPISEPLPLKNPVEPERTRSEDFDAALIEAVAASVASTADDPGDAVEHSAEDINDHAADVLKADEFNPSIFSNDKLDPHVTAAELLSDGGDVVEEDEADTVDESATLKAKRQSTQAEPSAEVAQSALPEAPEPDADTSSAPAATGEAIAALAALPDEEAMRLLISRMIRDELQGDLGERITRNVRKLVRREVQRALTSKDLT